MEKLQLVIPTHARPTRQHTLNNLPKELLEQTIVVTSTTEDRAYIRYAYPYFGDVVKVPASVNCIAEKRHWIMRNIPGEMLFMMDDDLQFYSRCEPRHRYWSEDKGAWQLYEPLGGIRLSRKASQKDLLVGFKNLRNRVGDYPAIGMSHRRHNDKMKEDWKENQRLMFAFGISPSVYRKERLRFDDVRCREDFHIALSLLERGYPNITYYNLYHNPGDFGAEGGASTERSLEQSDEQAQVLADLHPGFVKVVDRVYGTSPSRKEVVIGWKKAYAASQQAGGAA